MIQPHTLGLDIWDLVLLENHELQERGVPACQATPLRLAFTGHPRALSRTWARTVGCWGGVAGTKQIGQLVGKTPQQVASYAQRRRLRYRTKRRRLRHPHLAAGLYYDRLRLSPEVSRRRWGVLGVERVLLMAGFQLVLDHNGASPREALEWPFEELAERWLEAGAQIHPPLSRLVASSDITPRPGMERPVAVAGGGLR